MLGGSMMHVRAQSCLTLCDPWTVAHQASLSMGFSRREYWSGLPSSSQRDLPIPGIEPPSPVLAGRLGSPPGSTVAMISCPTAFLFGHPPRCRDHMTSPFIKLPYQGKSQSHATGACLTSELPIWAAPYPMDSPRTPRGCVLMVIC